MLEKYHYTQNEQDELINSMVIICDTREQKNQHITQYFDSKNVPWKSMKLEYGDYSFYVPKNEDLGIPRDIYFDKELTIERKANLDEFAGNIVKDRSRIKKELALAPPNKILVIENATYGDMIKGNYMSKYSAKSYYGTVHSFWHEFNMPFIFIEDKKYTGVFIRGYCQYYLKDIIK